jgi:hypothetical protein
LSQHNQLFLYTSLNQDTQAKPYQINNGDLFDMEANKHKQYQQYYNIQVAGTTPYFLILFDIHAFINMEISRHTLI